ncbi:MAG TPA: nucleoside-diphosphate-sugar pyrophosphorylase [Holosporales bacterium]|nr:nucleoside-diphosphate-sugar pyrophosphorylase [Holosporales bacterium]
MSKRAVILAGGKGTRLKPYTVSLPKPLVPIVDKPILEIIIQQLAKNGFNHITLTINHMAEIIKAFCGDGSKWGVKIDYSLEDIPLSTMGPLKLINDLPENFLVMNGDVLTDLNFSGFYDFHIQKHNLFTISSFQRQYINDYGVLEINQENQLSNFKEKPVYHFEVSMGVYMANRKIIQMIPEGIPFGFDHLMYAMLKSNTKVAVKRHDSYWLDIGRPDDYEKAAQDYNSIIKNSL